MATSATDSVSKKEDESARARSKWRSQEAWSEKVLPLCFEDF